MPYYPKSLPSILTTLSEAAAVNKMVPNARANAWPMQGGLQSITNNSTVRTDAPSSCDYVEVTAKTSNADIDQETIEVNIHTNTPSPDEATGKVELSGGKENVSSTA